MVSYGNSSFTSKVEADFTIELNYNHQLSHWSRATPKHFFLGENTLRQQNVNTEYNYPTSSLNFNEEQKSTAWSPYMHAEFSDSLHRLLKENLPGISESGFHRRNSNPMIACFKDCLNTLLRNISREWNPNRKAYKIPDLSKIDRGRERSQSVRPYKSCRCVTLLSVKQIY